MKITISFNKDEKGVREKEAFLDIIKEFGNSYEENGDTIQTRIMDLGYIQTITGNFFEIIIPIGTIMVNACNVGSIMTNN